jgi:glycosyltransferase involved in cell wall biosynthesis
MGFMPRIVVNILCHNDLIYLQNLIPQVQRFSDRIIVVDDCSTDGTGEYLSTCVNVQRIERKFDLNFSNQRNVALQEVDDGDWIFRIDSDETLSDRLVDNLPHVLDYCEGNRFDRVSVPIFHMVNFDMCKLQLGLELRLFKKNHTCIYIDTFHERVHGIFPKDTRQITFPEHYTILHCKYADRSKIDYTKSFFIQNNLYDPDDLRSRIEMEATFLPADITYTINPQLRDYLCTQSIYGTKE